VDEIDVRVGFEQIAPSTLAGVRLAGDEQYAQFFAYAFNRQCCAIVERREFSLEPCGLDLNDVRSSMGDFHRHFGPRAGDHRCACNLDAVAANDDRYGGACGRAFVLDAVTDGLALADNAEARRCVKHDAAVALAGLTGNERVHRRIEAEERLCRHVMNAAIGDEDRARHAIGRHFGKRRAQGRK
jgi:hypothetical protein